jgi:hypothetical protein
MTGQPWLTCGTGSAIEPGLATLSVSGTNSSRATGSPFSLQNCRSLWYDVPSPRAPADCPSHLTVHAWMSSTGNSTPREAQASLGYHRPYADAGVPSASSTWLSSACQFPLPTAFPKHLTANGSYTGAQISAWRSRSAQSFVRRNASNAAAETPIDPWKLQSQTPSSRLISAINVTN